jgi:alanine-glyoxylate transaminase/serine-glyoxylate transaminase/serine-pyruvate transaminase
VPPYIDSAEIVKHAWKRYNLSLGLGLNKVAGKVFRIGHLGNLNEVLTFLAALHFALLAIYQLITVTYLLQLQLLGCLSGVEMVLKDVGYPVKLGSGVAAAAAYLSNSTPLIPSRI